MFHYFQIFFLLFCLAFSSHAVFAQDTLSSEVPAAGSSAPVQVVPADPDLYRPEMNAQKGALVSPTQNQQVPDFHTETISPSQGTIRTETVSSSQSSSSNQILSALNINEMNSYSSNLELREQRKIGFGTAIGGDAGMLGFKAEFNFEDADGAMFGIGWGPGYQAFSLNWKHVWEGFLDTELSPYVTAGYAHWSHVGEGNYSGSEILKQALSEEQKETRRFGVDFIPVFTGLQYFVLAGEGAGLTFYAEVGLLNQINPQRQMILTGGIGSTFYF